MNEQSINVLFLCTGNSARSILAEAVLCRLGQGRFQGYSAGSDPKGEVHPFALDLLKQGEYPTAHLRSKSWAEFADAGAPRLDFIFTVCGNAAGEVCPVWPGRPTSAHWGLPDPAAVEGTDAERRLAFADCLRMLNRRIEAFVSLPFDQLDGVNLQRQIDGIGGEISQADLKKAFR